MNEPRTHEHARLRAGKISGSRFHTVMYGTPTAWNTLLEQLRAERANPDLAVEHFLAETSVPSLNHGHEHEEEALKAYEWHYMETHGDFPDLRRVGWISYERIPDYVGVSPDAIVDPDGGAEVKCPYNDVNHLECFVNGMPEKHRPQVQGSMMATGRPWWDFVSFYPYPPEHPLRYRRLYVERIHRDEAYIDRLYSRCVQLIELLDSGEKATAPELSDVLSSLKF